MLVEFASAVDAVRSAVDLQRSMAAQNADVSPCTRIEFRIGIHVGDIIIDDSDIFGDGVNIAARLEGIAETGGVYISEDAHRQIRSKVNIAFDDIGMQVLKNIAEPMRVWRCRIGADAASSPNTRSSVEVAQPLPLPDKPSIAVLPFQNMSGDLDLEYFADRITEEITVALSRIRWLFVIARNSAFTFKGKSIDVRSIGKQLGVRFILEGSVRKARKRVRIAGELIDTVNGFNIWADRFDGSLDDIFALQDSVTEGVVTKIAPKLRTMEIDRASIVNNGGGAIGGGAALQALTHDDILFEKNVFLNLTSAYYATRASLPQMVMQDYGRVTSSLGRATRNAAAARSLIPPQNTRS